MKAATGLKLRRVSVAWQVIRSKNTYLYVIYGYTYEHGAEINNFVSLIASEIGKNKGSHFSSKLIFSK